MKYLITKSISTITLVAALCSCQSNSSNQQTPKPNYIQIEATDTPEQIAEKAASVVPSERQFIWQQQELTAFIHFGMNTFYGSEWGEGNEDPARFNPEGLDAEQWVSTLKEAGFKCAILTCKHHDGFCLWPSAYTEHSVKNSPWKNGKGDIVKEVADACKKYGISFGVYLSPWDRNNQLYGTPEYNDYFVNQLTELLTNYGEVGEVWFDGACGEGPNGKKQEYDFPRWYELIRKLQPKAVIAVMGPDVRWVGTETGRGRKTEWSVVPNDNLDQEAIAANSQQEMIIPPSGDMVGDDLGSRKAIANAKTLVWYPAEIDVSIRPGWFYHEDQDSQVKTPEQLMDIYFTSVGMNGVLLLNIPPNKNGLFAQPDVESLMGFRLQRETLYADNILKRAKVETKGKKGKATIDGIYDTSCYAEKGNTLEIKYELKNSETFNVICLQEEIREGQRVEAFKLEYKNDEGEWVEAVAGTTIGYKRLIEFESVTASKIKLTITESRRSPILSEVGLYNYKHAE